MNTWLLIAIIVNIYVIAIGVLLFSMGATLKWLENGRSPVQGLADHLAACIARGKCPAQDSWAHVALERFYYWPLGTFGHRMRFMSFVIVMITVGYPIVFDMLCWAFTGKRLFFPDKSV